MRKLWCLLSLIPLVAFSQSDSKDFFSIEDQAEEALLRLSFDDEIELDLSHSPKNFNHEHADALLFEGEAELEECLDTALPWLPEKIGREEITNYVEDKAKNGNKKYDEDFTCDLSVEHEEIAYQPSLETVPKRTSKVFNRPKVVESKETKTQNTQDSLKKSSSSSVTASAKKTSSVELKRQKLKEIREKRKILTNRNAENKQKNKVVLKTESENLSE